MFSSAEPGSPQAEPTVAARSVAGWRAWLRELATTGHDRISAFGLTLILGFVFGFVALAAFAAIAEDVIGQETLVLDNGVLAWLHQFSSPTMDLVARGLSAMGSEVVAGLMVLLLISFGVQRRWGAAVGLVITVGGAQLLNNVLKDLFHRTRPAPVAGDWIAAQAFSFPSGHAMVSAAFYTYVGYLGWRMLESKRARFLWATSLTVLVLLIGVSRMYLGVHYLTDVFAGYAVGILWADTVILSGRLLGRRRSLSSRRDPAVASRSQ